MAERMAVPWCVEQVLTRRVRRSTSEIYAFHTLRVSVASVLFGSQRKSSASPRSQFIFQHRLAFKLDSGISELICQRSASVGGNGYTTE